VRPISEQDLKGIAGLKPEGSCIHTFAWLDEKMKPKYRRAFLVGLVAAVIGIVFSFASIGMRKLEHSWFLKLRGPVQAPPEVVIISNNKQAADKLQQSRDFIQWPRHLHADLIKELVRRGASVIVFDIVFSDPSNAREDADFAAAIKKSERVVLAEYIEENRYPELVGTKVFSLKSLVETISDAARGLGPFPLESSGKMSQFWTFKDVGGELPTLPAVALQVYGLHLVDDLRDLMVQSGFGMDGLPKNSAEITNAEELREYMYLLRSTFKKNTNLRKRILSLMEKQDEIEMTVQDRRILLSLVNLYSGKASYYYNFYGPLGTIETIRYDEILPDSNNNQERNRFKFDGKVVFIGDSEPSGTEQQDSYHTVFTDDGVQLTGVELAATVFGNLLDGSMLQRNIPFSFISLLLFGLFAGGLSSLVPGMRAIGVMLVLTVGYFFLAIYLFIAHGLWISLSSQVLVQAPLGLFMGLFCQYWYARKEQERLSVWVPDKVENIPQTGLVFGTCLFTDIRGSRRLSGSLGVQEYKSLMDAYHNTIKQPVVQNSGRIWDFYGDGMMGLFAARKPDTGLRLRVGMTAMEILRKVEEFNRQQPEINRLRTGIGLHSGWIEMGGTQLGDVGNTVSSIEGLNKLLSTQVLASQEVIDGFGVSIPATGLVTDGRESFFVRQIGSFLLSGKTEPISVFELIDPRERRAGKNRADCNIYKLLELSVAALNEFENQNWQEAAKKYEEVLRLFPDDGPSRFLMGKCREYCSKKLLPGEAAVIRIGSEE